MRQRRAGESSPPPTPSASALIAVRLALVHIVPMPSREASTVGLARLADALTRKGHETWTVLPAHGRAPGSGETVRAHYGLSATPSIVRWWRPRKGPGRDLVFGSQVASWARLRGLDAVHTRLPSVALCTTFAGVPTVIELHAPPSTPKGWNRLRHLSGRRTFLGYVSITHALADELRAHLGPIDEDAIVVAPDAAELVSDHDPQGSPGGGLHVCYVGSLYPGKGMEIISALASSCPWATFHVVGGSDQEIAAWRSRYGAESVVFHGAVPHGAVGEHLRRADVAVLPMLPVVRAVGGQDIGRWTSPLKLFEYMAYGLPIIATDVAVLREVLTHEENALLCRHDDQEAWVAALERLREDTVLRRRLGQRAREQLADQYTWDARAERLTSFIDRRLTRLRAAR